MRSSSCGIFYGEISSVLDSGGNSPFRPISSILPALKLGSLSKQMVANMPCRANTNNAMRF
jgi:hypothetical protein